LANSVAKSVVQYLQVHCLVPVRHRNGYHCKGLLTVCTVTLVLVTTNSSEP